MTAVSLRQEQALSVKSANHAIVSMRFSRPGPPGDNRRIYNVPYNLQCPSLSKTRRALTYIQITVLDFSAISRIPLPL